MGKYLLILACLLLTACSVDGYEPPEKSSADSGVDSGSAHADSGSADSKTNSHPDAVADVTTQDSTDSAPAVPDSGPDTDIDTGMVDSGTEAATSDATPDSSNDDPCDIPPLGSNGAVWDCSKSCPTLPYGNDACEPSLSDTEEMSVGPAQTGPWFGHIVLLPGYYRFRVEQGGCARFTAVGTWKFVVDNEHYAVDFSKATSCLVVSGWGHPEGHTGVLVQAKSYYNSVGRIDFESVAMAYKGTCPLSCP